MSEIANTTQQSNGAAATGAPVLRIEGLGKSFGATRALDDVSLEIRPDEIHALVGENGAGKSTLIKILAGVYDPDEGQFRMNGEEVDPQQGRLPIAFIHQDLGLVEAMSVAENVAIVDGYSRSRGLISWRRVTRAARESLSSLGSTIDPGRTVSELTAAERSVVALARALTTVRTNGLGLLVLDEPTASLPEHEVAVLFDALERLRDLGVSMLYVTHRMEEVRRLSNRVTVLRDGKNVITSETGAISGDQLIEHIIGRPLSQVFVTPEVQSGATTAIELKELKVRRGAPVSFAVDRGEIVALVGLIGAGHDRVGRAIFGAEPVESGEIYFDGKATSASSPVDAVRLGIGFVSSKRGAESLAPGLTVRENLFLNKGLTGSNLLTPATRGGELKASEQVLDKFDIRPRDPERPIETLSGGNQQKAVLARWMLAGRRLLILEEPTIGVDVGAKSQIYGFLREFVEGGGAILLVSSDAEEVVGIAHRALVFNRGSVAGELSSDQLSIENLTHLAGKDDGDEQLTER